MELLTDDNPLKRGLDAAAARIKSFGESLSAIGEKIGSAGGIVSSPFVAAAKTFADAGKELNSLALVTGTSAERISELAFAAGGVDNLTRAFGHLSRTLDAADLGSKEATTAINRLGLTSAQLAGLPLGERFTEIVGRLGDVQDSSTRAAIAFRLFGEGAGELLPALARGREGMDQAIARGRELGLIMSGEQVASAVALSKAYKLLDGALKGIWQAVGAAVAPALTELVNAGARVVLWVSRWVRGNRELIVTIFQWASAIAGAGAAIAALGAGISAATKLLSGFSAIFSLVGAVASALISTIGLLLSPIGLVVAAVGGVTAAFLTMTDAGRATTSYLGAKFREVAGTAASAWQGIKDSLAAGDIGGALSIAWQGVKVAWAQLTIDLRVKWGEFTAWVRTKWEEAKVLLLATWEGFRAAFLSVTEGIRAQWDHFTSTISAIWQNTTAGISLLWDAMTGNLSAGMDETAAAAGESAEAAKKSWLDTINEWYFGLLRVRDLMREMGFELGGGLGTALDAVQALNEGLAAGDAAAAEGVRKRQGELEERRRQIEEDRRQREQELQEDLQRQKDELQAAIDDAARKRAEAAGGGAGPGGAAPVNPAAEAADRAQVAGGFNVVSGGMGFATSLAERQLQAAQETNKKLGNIFDVLKEGGETFR